MVISRSDLDRWKDNSLKLAYKLGYDRSILDRMNQTVRFVLTNSFPPQGNWFGWCHCYDNEIEIFNRNLSTEPIEIAIAALQADGLPDELIKTIVEVYNEIGKEVFFEVYNQSGMDHELIGHMYHSLTTNDLTEKTAVYVQLALAKKRSKSIKAWKQILKIMPIVLAYHKDIDELK